MRTQTKDSQDALTPEAALQLLKDGNARFRENLRGNRDLLCQVDETKNGQWPFAAILSCIDSRASAELIFDQGIGDIFSVRIAGNVVNEDILGSLEFACAAAGAKVIVVVGHSSCGAVKGACDGVELGHLTGLLGKIGPAIDEVKTQSGEGSGDAFIQSVATTNVRHALKEIPERSEVLRDLKKKGTIDIVGAFYDVGTGRVDFL